MSVPARVKGLAIDAACSRPVADLLMRVCGGRLPGRGGVRVDLSHPSVPPRIRAAVFWRLHERSEIGLIHRHLPRDVDVVELGASVGVTGAHILHLLGPGRRFVAVEANPALLPNLERALDDPRAALVHAAVAYEGSDPDGDVTFHIEPSVLLSRLVQRPGGRPVTVPATTLRRLLADHRIGDYALVADIEGAEAGLLADDSEALEKCRMLIIELHDTRYAGRDLTVADTRRHLADLGFREVDRHRRTVAMVRP